MITEPGVRSIATLARIGTIATSSLGTMAALDVFPRRGGHDEWLQAVHALLVDVPTDLEKDIDDGEGVEMDVQSRFCKMGNSNE